MTAFQWYTKAWNGGYEAAGELVKEIAIKYFCMKGTDILARINSICKETDILNEVVGDNEKEEYFTKRLSWEEMIEAKRQYDEAEEYCEGIEGRRDLKKAWEIYKSSANKGYIKAQYKFGMMNYYGMGGTVI